MTSRQQHTLRKETVGGDLHSGERVPFAMTSENARQRQVHRYYKAWQDVQDFLHEDTAYGQAAPFDITLSDHVPRTSQDKALTAFAQLAALRLDVKRVIISLVDTNKQYILAEATKSISLMHDTRHDDGDQLAFGKSVLFRESAICPKVLDSTFTTKDEDGDELVVNALVIEDALNDERFKDIEIVKDKGIRFFAGVPVTTKTGVKLGTYTVLSDAPRHDFSLIHLNFLQDVAEAVFEHLALAKGRLDSVGGARMVHGLTTFIEHAGVPAINMLSSTSEPAEPQKSTIKGVRVEIDDDEPISLSTKRPTLGSVRTTSKQTLDSSLSAPGKGGSKSIDGDSMRSFNSNDLSSNRSDVSTVYSDSKKMFSRAADVLRRSTLADGCIFFDATSAAIEPKTMNGGAEKSNNRKRSSSKGSDRSQGSGDKHDEGSDSPGDSPSDTVGTSESDASDPKKRSSDILGVSLTQSDIKSNDGAGGFVFSEQDLRRCIHRYPRGKIFNFNDQGAISSGDDTMSDRSPHVPSSQTNHNSSPARDGPARGGKGNTRVRRFVAEEIVKVLPGVKSVVFLPLWEFAQERWYAGAFLWTTQHGRLMDMKDEFPYIKAFGNSIMSEISRLDALYSERAKTTFIASISHELRSPLHGILGSIEFLHDTSIDSFQNGLVTNIEQCGKTLLDTIDHVLDFAKINSFGSGKSKNGQLKGRRTHRAQNGALSKMTLTSTFDLCVLVEEVVDAIFAGQTFRRTRMGPDPEAYDHNEAPVHLDEIKAVSRHPKDQLEIITHQQNKFCGKLAVVINVTSDVNWKVRTQPGAIRRIVMSLLGNALKYTDSGFVKVTLRPSTSSIRKANRIPVDIIVSDSGRGMSEEFLRDRLYKPFSQEDPFSVGTGLGLSIVRQIVDSLHGRISVQSEQGKGTEITVILNLPTATGEEAQEEGSKALTLPVKNQTSSRTVCILDPYAGKHDVTENDEVHDQPISDVLASWFGMNVIKADHMDGTSADLFLYAEPPPVALLLAMHEEGGSSDRNRSTPLIIICTNAFEAAALMSAGVQRMKDLGSVVEIVSQPCGPLKMAKVLERCLPNLPKGAHGQLTPDESPKSTEESAKLPDTESTEDAHLDSPSATSTKLDANHTDSASSDDAENKSRIVSTPLSSLVSEKCSKVVPIREMKPHPPPLRPPPPQRSMTDRSDGPRSPISSTGLTPFILVVDDNSINLQLLVTFMKKNSIPHAAATDGLEALNKYKEQHEAGEPFAYILMDISMPVMDGLESTEEIRKYERKRQKSTATIVALTGLASQTTQEEAFRAGFDHFLPKPVKFRELKKLLDLER